jgi:8-oxo-dGTP pyrophosphatase MutT (NUDIX family)/predicted GNAT family acetyltransferase
MSVFDQLQARNPGVRYELYPTIKGDEKRVYLTGFMVPYNERGKGLGTKFMEDLIKVADENGFKITLTPSSSYGGNVIRLKQFYKGFGFIENKGQNRDFSHREDMYRDPKGLNENADKLIKMAHDAITRRKGKDYAPDVHELQAWIDNHLKDKKMNEAKEKEKSRIALLFIVIDNKVLLFKRSPEETTNPGKYGMLGGHIEKGENPEEALRREVKEEAGVEVGSFKKLKTYELDEVQLNVFYTNEFDTENIKLDKKEHTGKKFFTLEELDNMSAEECIDTNKGIARDYNKKAQEEKQLNESIERMKTIIGL